MKVLMIINSLVAGGAERQCVTLAMALNEKGHHVSILGYERGDHFLKELTSKGIDYRLILEGNPLLRILKFRRAIRKFAPQAVIAFLATSSALAELSSIPSRKWRLVVSERNNDFISPTRRTFIHLRLHSLADHVTTNAEATTGAIKRVAPYLEGKLKTIYNGLDTHRFSPSPGYPSREKRVLVVVSSHQDHKNAKNLILAMKALQVRGRVPMPMIYWYGSDMSETSGVPSAAYLKAMELIRQNGLHRDFIFSPPIQDIEHIYANADAVIHPSFKEGMPNAVCEGISCGLPVLMGQVSDYKILTDGNGRSFDSHSVESIIEALEWFLRLSREEVLSMKERSREIALKLFNRDHFVDEYEKLIH